MTSRFGTPSRCGSSPSVNPKHNISDFVGPLARLLLSAAFAVSCISSAVAVIPVGIDPMRLARVPTGGIASGCAVVGNLCYVAAGASGLLILDITDPAHPVSVGTFATRKPAQSVFPLDRGALVIEQPEGSELLDLSSPTHPVRASEWSEVRGADAVFVSRDQLFIAGGASLRIVDIHDLYSPALRGAYSFPFDGEDAPLNNIRSVAARGGFAYCGDGDLLWVFDVRDPAHIRQIGLTDIPQGDMTDIVLSGSMAFAAAQWGGLHQIDLTDPGHPKVMGEIQGLGGWPHSIVVSGDRAVVATEQGWVVFLDLSNPYSPLPIGGYLSVEALDVQVSGGLCYVAGGSSGLEVVDLLPANPSIPALPSIKAGALAVRDSLAVLASDGVLRTLELSPTGEVKPLGEVYGGMGGSIQVAIGDGFASYVSVFGDISDGGNFRTIDVSDPAHPRRMGSYNAADEIDDYVLSGPYAYLSLQFQGLRILDLSDPALPTVIGTLPISRAVSVSADAGLLCLAQGQSGVGVVDVQDPARPALIGRYEDGPPYQSVLVRGSRCYAADAAGGLRVLDLSEPARPRLVGRYASSIRVKRMLFAEPSLYLWGNGQRLEVVDVSDPSRIWRVGGNSMAVHRNADLAADQGRVWISGFGEGGLTFLPHPLDLMPDRAPGVGGGQFGFRLYARPGEPTTLERSDDLKVWSPWKTVIPGDLPMRLQDDAANGSLPAAFFRVRETGP